MYDAEKRMQEIMEAPQITAAEKSKLNSDKLIRLLTFKNKMENHHLPVKTTPPSASVPPTSDERAEITPQVPNTPKTNLLTPPVTEEERPKLKRIFFQNWVDPAEWSESDLVRMNPEAREDYERFFTEGLTKIYSYETRADSKVIARRQTRV